MKKLIFMLLLISTIGLLFTGSCSCEYTDHVIAQGKLEEVSGDSVKIGGVWYGDVYISGARVGAYYKLIENRTEFGIYRRLK